MEIKTKFDLSKVRVYNIVLVVSSQDMCCDWDRIYFVGYTNLDGEWDYNSYLLIDGSHCSCYGFESAEWTATSYTHDELKKLVEGWIKTGWGTEKEMAKSIIEYMNWGTDDESN